jgi:hypothetical protein
LTPDRLDRIEATLGRVQETWQAMFRVVNETSAGVERWAARRDLAAAWSWRFA